MNCYLYQERIPSLSAFMRISEPQIWHNTDAFIYPLYEIKATLCFISCFSHMWTSHGIQMQAPKPATGVI